MIILLCINALPFYLGLRMEYCTIGHFNDHFQFLNNRAKELGWEGNLGRFNNFLYSPIIEWEFFTIENLSTSLCLSYLRDENHGDFIYNNGAVLLRLRENWNYWTLPFDLKFNLKFGSCIFISGFIISITRLNINVEGNYQMNGNYPIRFTSDDVGLFAGLIKRFKKFSLEIVYRYMQIDQFYNDDGYLYYEPYEKYIYIGPQYHRNPSAVLNHSGLDIRFLYRIF